MTISRSPISMSPDRNSFQKESHIKNCRDKGLEPNTNYLNMCNEWAQKDIERGNDPEWQKDNMEYDLRTTEWILTKVRESDVYAQHLYAAMCNREFMKADVWPILTKQRWSCSWRHAGGIIADMQQTGDYIDWYCSGMRDPDAPDNGYVPEGHVTEQIQNDLMDLGWIVLEDLE